MATRMAEADIAYTDLSTCTQEHSHVEVGGGGAGCATY